MYAESFQAYWSPPSNGDESIVDIQNAYNSTTTYYYYYSTTYTTTTPPPPEYWLNRLNNSCVLRYRDNK